ncbi:MULTISPECIES: MerR family transcriptional regulator [Saccharibacillus]|uniref:MerR family transcriptional regulator n=1 Tax=Saccharibacillus brassicae TaxID=2583377 RepID=A0A4Y6V1N2_SACBS|nr:MULTISPECIES: MerR family transcriptional regulator [Saccharibacillus]MWJ30494.1 MerR family transcriptional regulator [Saccharibacillus sp. WB 17]QDH23274.1 MerR family transcriptional regulator [Saccharibacillus brassicae]
MNPNPTYSIKQLGELTGVTSDTIRFYEKAKVMPAPCKKANGHRIYSEKDLHRLQFIVQLKKTSMTLQEIKEYLTYSDTRQYEHCYRILYNQQQQFEKEIEEMQKTLDLLNYKVNNFKHLIESTRGVSLNEDQTLKEQ